MKRLLLTLALLTGWAFADGQQSNSFTTTGQGLSVNNIGSGISYHKLTWTKVGTVTVCSVRIDGSADGISWGTGDVLAAQDCSANGTATSSSIQKNYTRVNVTSFTGTGSVSIPYNLYINNPAGGGGGITNGAAANVIPKSDGTNLVTSLLDDGSTTTNTLTYSGSGGIATTGATGSWTCSEGPAISGAVGKDVIYCDSTAHRPVMKNNNGSALNVVVSGTDINTSDQVTTTHLAAALPVAQGGTALTSGTSGGILGYTASGTLASSGALTAGILVKGGGAGATPGNSLVTDNGTTAAYTGTGGYVAPLFVANGANAGYVQATQGTAQGHATANTVTLEAAAAVTAYEAVMPPVAAAGTLINNNTSAVVTQGFSGDTNHSATVTIGSGTSIGSTSLCSTTFCTVGTYRVNVYVDITTACGTSGTYIVNLIYTDDVGSKTIPVNIDGTGSVPATGTLTTTSTANFGEHAQIIRSTGAASINYSTTAVACGTAGPMVGKLYLSVEPVQ